MRRLARDLEVVNSVAWSGDGSVLVASARGSATVWAADGWDPVRSLAIGGGGMLPVALSRDGRRLALGWDNHVALWSADEEQPAVTIDGLPKGVYGLAFSRDSTSLAMAAADGRVRTWDVT